MRSIYYHLLSPHLLQPLDLNAPHLDQMIASISSHSFQHFVCWPFASLKIHYISSQSKTTSSISLFIFHFSKSYLDTFFCIIIFLSLEPTLMETIKHFIIKIKAGMTQVDQTKVIPNVFLIFNWCQIVFSNLEILLSSSLNFCSIQPHIKLRVKDEP